MNREEIISDIHGWLELKVTTGRYSKLFVEEIADFVTEQTVNIHHIYDEVSNLEGLVIRRTSTKSATEYKGETLKGLWHKHYSQGGIREYAKNTLSHWSQKKNMNKLKNIMVTNSSENKMVDALWINKLIHEYVMGGYRDRSLSRQMTGECIVFAKHQDVNYYLTFASHENDPDSNILARARSCAEEFPELDILRK